MASYGPNFDARVPPRAEARGARFLSPAAALSGSGAGGGTASFTGGAGQLTFPAGMLPIGCPVIADLSAGQDAYGRQYVKLPSAGALTTAQGIFGICVYEYGPAAYRGFDPVITVYSDLGFVPLGDAIQVWRGDPATKIVLTNTYAETFLGIQNYPGRIMVNGLSSTPTVTVGDYLVPGSGNDTDGYWESTATAAGAWAVITLVDTTHNLVEARLLF